VCRREVQCGRQARQAAAHDDDVEVFHAGW
jgi:hypothetical protein